ncbi:MAG: FmdB family zinc ribbon protein [Candidatus Acidiferrales bacterium]
MFSTPGILGRVDPRRASCIPAPPTSGIIRGSSTRESHMPIYEYVCDKCKSRYERIVTAKNSAPACPKCGSARSTIQFSTFAAHPGNGSSARNSSASAPSTSSGCECTPHSCGCH